ncbi:MAG: ABC transporter substrate-binding protein [Peptococcaceae bacterium]|jgi:branched-chain amino acid transport system substrate-binding protein|nr:ABC transporter substrate-binding protein [Peptococcaceae bacterium]
MKRTKLLSILIASALVLVMLGGCGGGTQNAGGGSTAGSAAGSAGEIKIGLVAPMTGGSGSMGVSQQQGYELAMAEINDAGGVSGRKITLTVYDDQGDPQTAASGAQKFADDDSIIALGGSCNSSATLAMMPIVDNAGIPDLVVSSSSPQLTGSSEYFFRMSVQDAAVGPQMAKALLDRGCKNVVVFYANNDYGVGLNDSFKTYLESNGGTVLSSLTYLTTDQDFTAQITTAKGMNPDAIALCGTMGDCGLIIKQLDQNGFAEPVIGGTGLYNIKMIEIAGDASEDVLLIGVYISSNPDEKVQTLVSKYTAKYGNEPDGFAALAYDQMYVIAEAAQAAIDAGGLTRESLKDALKKTDYDGVTGRVSFNSDNDWVRDYLTLMVKDGNFVMAE